MNLKVFHSRNTKKNIASNSKVLIFGKKLCDFDKPKNHLKVPPETAVKESGKVLRTIYMS